MQAVVSRQRGSTYRVRHLLKPPGYRRDRNTAPSRPDPITTRPAAGALASWGEALWEYEPDQVPKRKHAWDNDFAGFAHYNNEQVGKCPNSLTLEHAKELLDEGLHWSPSRWNRDHPKRIYAVKDGVLYRATWTNPGRSYHGFPEHPSRFPKGSSELREKLIEAARMKGCENELKRWMEW